MESTLHESYHLSKVASILKVSRPLVLKMAKTGELPCQRTPEGLTIHADRLNAWVEARRVNPLIDSLRQKK
jgi:excisionase family DNA binding protein